MSLPSELLPVGLLGTGATGGYEIERSLRFNSADSAYLSRTPASAGNRKTWTWVGWVKRATLGGRQNFFQGGNHAAGSNSSYFEFGSDNKLRVAEYNGSAETYTLETTQLFRDTGAWFHLVIAFDTTQSTATNRIKIFVNGGRITDFVTASYPSENQSTSINNNVEHNICREISSNTFFFSGYLADIHFIDGQALDPTSFGEFDDNGIWQPIAYDGEYGTNGFKLDFSDNSAATAITLGADSSGNGNNWTPNNLSVTAGAGNDSLIDVPQNGTQTDTGLGGEVRGNYATFNPLTCGSAFTLSNGNLDISDSGASSPVALGTIAVNSGKWYWEVTLGNQYAYVGAAQVTSRTSSSYLGEQVGQFIYNTNAFTSSWINGVSYNYSTASNATTGDIIGIALNFDSNVITFYKNGVSQGTFGSNVLGTSTWAPAFKSNVSTSAIFNFGQRPFAYTAPSGFKALNTANLPTPTILDGSDYMDVVTYTGNGSTQTISGLEFSPDLVWLKARSSGGSSFTNHVLVDSVRGAGPFVGYKNLYSNLTDSEFDPTSTATASVTALNSDGFALGGNANTNTNTMSVVAWTWDAGSTTVTNTDGSITSSVRANPSAGFSIVTYTGNGTAGATVGHGLGVSPSLVIIKNRDSAGNNWVVLGGLLNSIASNGVLYLNTTGALFSAPTSTAVSSTIFTLTTGSDNNENTKKQVAYCFAPVEGYSAFGSYTGNGSSDGSFVYTGFRPRWILYKSTGATGWAIHDTRRSGYNVFVASLYPNGPDSEYNGTGHEVDILSNGFKLRNANSRFNTSGQTYIYAAFAENPFSVARAR